MKKMKELLQLYLLFAKIGAFTFGGGYAMLPILQRELAEKRDFTTEEELLDYYAIGQLTPGVIAVNVSTFIGYKRCGVLGGIIATLGMITPSVIIISIIAAVLRNFADIYLVKCAFAGIRIAVLALIVKTIVKMTKAGVKDGFTCLIMLLTFGLMFVSVPSVCIVLGAALLGLLIKRLVIKK